MNGPADGPPSSPPQRLRGTWEQVGSIRHWELLVLMAVAAATLVGYFGGSLLVVYRLFSFLSLELFVGVAIVAVLIGT